MRVIIAGSRTFSGMPLIEKAIKESHFAITTLISGHALGIDREGEYWAHFHNVPIEIFEPDWETYGRRAGIIRNETMAKNADALIAIWDGKSKGTKHMIEMAEKYNLSKYILVVPA